MIAKYSRDVERSDQWEVIVPAPPRKPNETNGGPVKYTVDRQDGSITKVLLNLRRSHMPPVDRMKATSESVRLTREESMSPETSSITAGEAVRIVHRRRYEGNERNAFPDKPMVIAQPMWLVTFSQDELKLKAWVLASGSIYLHLPRNPPDNE